VPLVGVLEPIPLPYVLLDDVVSSLVERIMVSFFRRQVQLRGELSEYILLAPPESASSLDPRGAFPYIEIAAEAKMRTVKGSIYIAVSMGTYKNQRPACLFRDRSGRMLSIPGGMERPPPLVDAVIRSIPGELATCAHGMTFCELFGRLEIVGMETRLPSFRQVTI
jgi:hypothetical protein